MAQRAGVGVVERVATVGGALDTDARQHAPIAHVLRDEDPSKVDERVVGEALLDQQAEAITRPRVGGEVEIRLEDPRQIDRELRAPPRPLPTLHTPPPHLPLHTLPPPPPSLP